MFGVKHKTWIAMFLAIAFLTLAQVAWWATTFVREVGTIEMSRIENLQLREKVGEKLEPGAAAQVHREAYHRRVMFVSESVFFALLVLAGLWLLHGALRVERKARETERNFIEVVTHESKTPLTALKLRLESVRERYVGDAALLRDLDLSLVEVRRLASVFEKTLNLNRVERRALRFEEVGLSDVVREVVRRLDPLIRERGVALELSLDDEATVNGDPYALQGSVQSLIENAVLYNNSASKLLSVEITRGTGRVRLAVRDNGPGIHPEDRARIFQRYYRGKSGTQVAGTGLGLYLAKTIAEAHQGALRLVDGSRGAHFEMELPA